MQKDRSEDRSFLHARTAAGRAEDPRLAELFNQLAGEEAARLRGIREALEQL